MYRSTPTATVVGLDVGTTKVCTLIARVFPEGWDTIGYASVPSRGISRATIVDLDEAAAAIANSVERAEQTAGMKVERAWVGITGHHIRAYPAEASLHLTDSEPRITQIHLEALEERARRQHPLDEDQTLLHIIHHQFFINGMGGIRHPIGLAARKVKLRTLLIAATNSFVRNLETCVRQAGVEVMGKVLEPLAVGDAVLSESERQLGTAVLDIGGGTTDGAVFTDGVLVDAFALPVGGNHVTRDLAIGLRTPLEEAERLKVLHGCALTERASDETIEVLELGRGRPRPIPKRVLAEIIEPRMRELLELAAERLALKGWMPLLAGGLVLTGGGSLLDGVTELAQEIFGLPVRLGEPNLPPGSPQELKSPIYSTVVGLVLHGIRHHRETQAAQPFWLQWWSKLWERLKSRLGF